MKWYNAQTAKRIFGDDAAYIPDYPDSVIAAEIAGDLIKDAICYALERQRYFLIKHKIENTDTLTGENKAYWQYLENRIDTYQKTELTLRRVKPLTKEETK